MTTESTENSELANNGAETDNEDAVMAALLAKGEPRAEDAGQEQESEE